MFTGYNCYSDINGVSDIDQIWIKWDYTSCNCNSLFDTTEKHIASTTIVILIHVICLETTLRIQRPGLLGILQTFITLVSLGLNIYYYELCNYFGSSMNKMILYMFVEYRSLTVVTTLRLQFQARA